MQLANPITRTSGRLTNRRQNRAHQVKVAVLPLPLLLVGCAAMFVSSYDEVTDSKIQDAGKTTEALIGGVLSNRTSYDRHAKEYRQVDGTVGALEMRATAYQKNEAEI